MVETRNGGDWEKTITADAAKSPDLQQLQDDMETAKLNYDKLARNDRATMAKFDSMATKVDSVEKKIETIAIDSTARFEALEKQMTFITDVLTRLEDSSVFNQHQGKEIASASQPPRDQVPNPISEPELPHTHVECDDVRVKHEVAVMVEGAATAAEGVTMMTEVE
ncbi:hypothetical protein Bca101_021096 [Brassica carinata]